MLKVQQIRCCVISMHRSRMQKVVYTWVVMNLSADGLWYCSAAVLARSRVLVQAWPSITTTAGTAKAGLQQPVFKGFEIAAP
jgi:hypothetical protein